MRVHDDPGSLYVLIVHLLVLVRVHQVQSNVEEFRAAHEVVYILDRLDLGLLVQIEDIGVIVDGDLQDVVVSLQLDFVITFHTLDGRVHAVIKLVEEDVVTTSLLVDPRQVKSLHIEFVVLLCLCV